MQREGFWALRSGSRCLKHPCTSADAYWRKSVSISQYLKQNVDSWEGREKGVVTSRLRTLLILQRPKHDQLLKEDFLDQFLALELHGG